MGVAQPLVKMTHSILVSRPLLCPAPFLNLRCGQVNTFVSVSPGTGLVNVFGTEAMDFLNTLALHLIY